MAKRKIAPLTNRKTAPPEPAPEPAMVDHMLLDATEKAKEKLIDAVGIDGPAVVYKPPAASPELLAREVVLLTTMGKLADAALHLSIQMQMMAAQCEALCTIIEKEKA